MNVSSPQGTYIAFAVSIDEGALGGDTCLYVREIKKDIRLLLGTLETKEVRVRLDGRGRKYDLRWENDETLTVDGFEYNIPSILQGQRAE